MDVYLAIGHGAKPDGDQDPGTFVPGSPEINEQSQGEKIVRAAALELSALGYDVHYQLLGDPAFEGTIAEVNADPPRLLVEVHHDWYRAPRGAFGFWHSSSPAGRRAADAIYAAVRAAGFPMRPDWHRPRDGLAIVRSTDCPTVLWECDRIGEVTDLEAYGRALAAGIDAALDKRAGDNDDQEDDDMAHLTEEDQQWLAQFVDEARTAEARPTSLWHVLRFYRIVVKACGLAGYQGEQVGRWVIERLTGRAAPR